VIGAEQRVEKERCDKGLTTSNNNKIKRIRHVNSSPRFKATRLQRMDSELQKGPNINTFYTITPRQGANTIQLHDHHPAHARR
jgi:hypothetical protein